MARQKCLRDLLRAEMKTLKGVEVTRFKAALRKKLPDTVKEAANEARKRPEKAQVKNKVTGGNNNG